MNRNDNRSEDTLQFQDVSLVLTVYNDHTHLNMPSTNCLKSCFGGGASTSIHTRNQVCLRVHTTVLQVDCQISKDHVVARMRLCKSHFAKSDVLLTFNGRVDPCFDRVVHPTAPSDTLGRVEPLSVTIDMCHNHAVTRAGVFSCATFVPLQDF